MSEKKTETTEEKPKQEQTVVEKQQQAKVDDKPSESERPVQVATPADDVRAAAETLLATVPDHLKGLIPDASPAEQIKWFRKASESGAFEKPAAVPTTDTTRPKSMVPEPDLSKLPPIARMSRGYGK